MDGPYRLVNELIAHSGPVRSLTQISHSPLQIASGCQADSPNVRMWTISGQEITETGFAIPHSHWVTALTSLSGGILSNFPNRAIVTGCYDSVIRVYDASSEVLLMSLQGHGKGIISFSWTADNKLISGSWDGTARIWDLERNICLHVLDSHENGVHVLGLSSGIIVTTSTGEAVDGKPANFQIRFWDATSGRKVGQSVQDHQGSIRSICSVPTLDGFATTSNDGTIAMRTGDGSVVASLVHPLQDDGIPPFVLDWLVR